MSGLDSTQKIFQIVKKHKDKIIPELHAEKRIILEKILEKDNVGECLNCEISLGLAFEHAIMLRDLDVLDFLIQESKKKFFRLKVKLVLVAAMVSFLNDYRHPEYETVKEILRKLDNKIIGLDFEDQVDDMQAKMTSNFVIKNVLDRPLEEKKGDFMENQTIYQDEMSKPIDTGFLYGDASNFFPKDEFKTPEKSKFPEPSFMDLDKTNINLNRTRRSHVEGDKPSIQKITSILLKKKIYTASGKSQPHIFPISPKARGKFLEAKDYTEIAIRYCLLSDTQIMDLLCTFYKEDNTHECLNIFPTYIYKLLIYYEKISIFEA